MPSDTPVLILPGFGNSGPQHWQTLWELRYPNWRRVNLGKWDAPACDDWVHALDVAVQACSSPPVLVAHSLACLLVAHWVHRLSRVPKGAFLVAVPDPTSVGFPASAQGFVPVPLVPFMFRSLVVASANDPLGSPAHAKHCAMAWGSMFIDIGQAGHINADSGHGEWPEGYDLFQHYVAQLMQIRIDHARPDDAPVIAQMVGELLREIMALVEAKTFGFHQDESGTRARSWITDGKYRVVLAYDGVQPELLGFLALYESYALYTDGVFGTIPEFYVRPPYRSKGVGAALMGEARRLGQSWGWRRIEVTTPPLPQFERTMAFYQREGFSTSGGRKLKLELS